MTIQLEPSLEARLSDLAAKSSRSVEELAHEGVERFLAEEEDLYSVISRGREDIAHGRVLAHDEVVARVDALLSQA